MSSLFSIGDDELDLDDEDCLLAACDLGRSMNSITDNSKKISDTELNQSSSATQLLRTKEVEKLKSNYQRRPFESISNKNTGDRAYDKKRIFAEQVHVHKSSSFTNWSTNSRTSQSITNGLNMPVTKRFAIDNTCNSPSNSANGGNMLRSSSVPGFSNTDGKAMTHSSLRTYPCNNYSPDDVQRNSCTMDLQIRELPQCSFTPSMSCDSSRREDHSNSISIPSRSDPTSTSKPLPRKELSKTINSSNAASSYGNSAVWQKKQPLMGSPVINFETGDFPKLHVTGNTNTACHDKTERQSANTFKNKIRTTDLETTRVSRQSAIMGPRTPQGNQSVTSGVKRQGSGTGPRMPQTHQAVTSGANRPGSGMGPSTPQTYQTVTTGMNRQSSGTGPRTPQDYKATTPTVNKNHARTPSSSRTPKTRKFPGPAGLLPKLSPGQNLEDASFASPLPTSRKPSPVQSKVSQSSASEDEDFNRDPWTYMYQDFIKNVPLAMRYTIIRVYTEAIQQTLDHGKVPCLCALVKAVSLTEADASVLLKDPTGEIRGTLHRKVLENYQTELAPGAGLILKHVSVFSPAPRKHYLNITPGNILQIYPSDPQNITSSQALASQCSQVERKQQEQRDTIENEEFISESVDQNERQSVSTAGATEEEPWNQKDCFEDLLEGLDDDEDFLDEALLV